MNTLRSLVGLVQADLFNRIRKPSFIFMIALTAYGSYLFAPPSSAGYATVVVGNQRLLYNSAGVGLIFAILISTFALPAYFFIKGTVSEDRQSGLGQIVATTPMHSASYLIGKWLSNLVVFMLLMVIMTIMSVIMQWTRAESSQLELQHLLGSIWLVGLPLMSFVAGLAILFETTPLLRGLGGSVAYFIIWLNLIDSPDAQTTLGKSFDALVGLSPMLNDIAPRGAGLSTGVIDIATISSLEWAGLPWSATMIFKRILWLPVGLIPALFGVFTFDRFRKPVTDEKPMHDWLKRQLPGAITRPFARLESFIHPPIAQLKIDDLRLTPLAKESHYGRWGAIIWAEIGIALKRQPWWWYLLAAGCFIYGFAFLPADNNLFLKMAIFLPLLIWSGMGVREKTHQTESVLFSAPHSLMRLVTATWLSGVVVSLLPVGGAALRFAFLGEWMQLAGIMAGSLFVPALALALGCWSGTTRLFELIYILWWYLLISVPLQPGVVLQPGVIMDFLSTSPEAISANMPLWYVTITVPILMVAYLGRWRYWQK